MPLPLAFPVALAVGAALALAGRQELVRSDAPLVRTRGFLTAVLYGTLVVAPVAAYFVAFHGDWAYLQLVPEGRIPSAVSLLLLVLLAGTPAAGFLVAGSRLRVSDGRPVLVAAAISAGLALALALVFARRLLTSATYAEWHGDYGREALFRSHLGTAVLTLGAAFVAGTVLAVAMQRPRGERSLLG